MAARSQAWFHFGAFNFRAGIKAGHEKRSKQQADAQPEQQQS
jgi:hypothetical protein